MKKTLLVALTACAISTASGLAFAAETQDSSDFKINGSVEVQYRADRNTNSPYGDATADGLKSTVLLNVTKKLADNLDFYARFGYQEAADNLEKAYAADYVSGNNIAIDQFGFNYNNAGWNYKLGAQSLSLGATGLLYDDNRFVGKHIFNNALTAAGKVGAVEVNTAIAQSNYADGIENDKLYYIHTGYAFDKSKVGFGYARANYGAQTAQKLYSGNSLNYYTADFSYKLADKLHFSSEFIKSSASQYNKGENLVLFSPIDKNNNAGVAWFRVEEQADIQQNYEGGMTYQWGNAQGYGIFWNHKLSDNITFSFTDFKMSKINAAPKSGMPNDQNTLRVGLSYRF